MSATLTGGSIRILWDEDDSADVTITGGIASFTVNGSPVTFPYTLTSSTTFTTTHSGVYTVSVEHHGYEVANTPDGTREVVLRFGEQAIFSPTPDGTPNSKFLADLHVSLAATYATVEEPTFESTAATETAVVGADLATSTGWTLGAGWTGTFATGFTKTAGNTNTLTWAPGFATGTKTYMVEFQVDTPSNADLNYEFTVTLGGSYAMVMYEGSFLSHDYSRGIRSTADGNLVFTPTSLFDGTISNISIKEVTTATAPSHTFKDSGGTNVLELRPTSAALSNVFMGTNTGRYNTTGKENVVIGVNSMAQSTSGFWNAAVGFEVLRDNVNGTRNSVLGFYALRENITGHRNIAIGPFALTRNTHGFANIGIGADTLWYNTTGTYNIGLGQAALGESITGDANTAIGRAALGAANGLSYHVAVGDYAAWQLTDESTGNQIAIGRRALRNATRGGNVAIGYEVALGLTTGHGHTVVGHEALQSVTTNLNCTAIGRYAVRYPTGERNTALGMNALAGASGANTAQRNTALGYGAGAGVISGADQNVFIGASAGSNVTSGANNILIGYNAQNLGPTDNYYLNLGAVLYGYMSGTKRLGVATVTNPTARLHLPANAAAANSAPLKFDMGGTLLTTPEIGAFEVTNAGVFFTDHLGVRKQFTLT